MIFFLFSIYYRSFKHNTSFVSRFSTIRRYKATAHSPLTRTNTTVGGSGGTGGGGGSIVGNYDGSQAHGTAVSEPPTRDDSISSVIQESNRLPGSVSEDSVAKEVCETSKRNSDGKFNDDSITTATNREKIQFDSRF